MNIAIQMHLALSINELCLLVAEILVRTTTYTVYTQQGLNVMSMGITSVTRRQRSIPETSFVLSAHSDKPSLPDVDKEA